MNYLADTHTFLWFVTGDKKTSATAKGIIEDESNDVFVSIASLWEIAIKLGLKKIDLAIAFETLFTESERLGIQIIPLQKTDLLNLLNLFLHHRDPFDRIMISQAQTRNLIIISKDEIFKFYDVKTIW